MRKHRPGLGIVLIATALAVVLAPQCGLLGHTVARILHTLIGSTGVVLLTTTVSMLGMVCLVPHGVVSRVLLDLRTRQRRPARVVSSARPPAQVIVMVPAKTQPKTIAAPTRMLPLRPQDDDVRAGLKSLQYTRDEIDSVIPQLDRSRSTEQQLRDALKLLRRAS